jgi:hypothetical protein
LKTSERLQARAYNLRPLLTVVNHVVSDPVCQISDFSYDISDLLVMPSIKCFDVSGLAVYGDKPNQNAVVFFASSPRSAYLLIQVGSAQSSWIGGSKPFHRPFPEP